MLYMSLDWHGTGRRQAFGCLYHWRRLERVAPRQAVEVREVGKTAFLAGVFVSTVGFTYAAMLKYHGSLLGRFLALSSGAMFPIGWEGEEFARVWQSKARA